MTGEHPQRGRILSEEVTPTDAQPSGSDADGPAAAPKLRVEAVTYQYGDMVAVDDVDVDIDAGEFVSILGPSGCGKTTLLRMIAGLRTPKSGRIYLDGRDITRLPPEKRPLGMVFQDLALFPHLSVADNVAFSLAISKVPANERAERVQAALEVVDLAGYEDRSVDQLSGGQRQRVALARSVIAEPEILLLDEPLGALDAAIRREMQLELKSLQRRLDITFLFVTHDQGEAMSMADRIILMNNGRIVQDAPPYEAYMRPVSTFAAGFFGDTNLLDATVQSVESDHFLATVGGSEVSLPVPPERALERGQTVQVSIRPEHVSVVDDADGLNRTRGKVVAQNFYGVEVVLGVECQWGVIRVREEARPELVEELIGSEISIEIATTHANLFDPVESG